MSDTVTPTSSRGLSVRGATKVYPGTTALDSVDLDVAPGEVVALLGENGAGKSTLSSIIAGVTSPTEGTMTWQGQPYSPADPGDAISQGIGLIHQEMRLLPDLSVAENVLVGRWPTRAGFLDERRMKEQAGATLRKLGFTGRLDQQVRELSVAGQQQVEIAKALMLDARLLILDEPTAALGQAETDALFATVAELKREGVSFIYVSHRLSEIARIADRIVVLRDGREVAAHDDAQVSPDQLVEEMVGRSVARLFPDIAAPTETEVLRVEGLSSDTGRFRDIDLTVAKGEVLGIAGIVGAGRTELVRAIAGADSRVTGRVVVDGRDVVLGDSRSAIRAGVVLVPEDRKQQGVIVDQSIEDNIVLPSLPVLGSGGWVGRATVRRVAEHAARSLGVKGRLQDPASSLSGGNQQKVVISKWLQLAPKVVILDEPTRGIDVGARASIYEVVAALAASGTAVVVVSSDLDEVLGLAHRVMVLADGESRGVLSRAEATPGRVMSLATA
ncbi:sugar ABC transporter ATP-binding protein [Frigoribacterium sp. VKM Ac-2530]|uniref:sugar ABC transporter ATP-binding protein n=1 Tax=Frigoribacterium sp. VKM Ac-2530 TaxID=2783822 RepID=UPI00188BD343|nr:sugar ABC transporter ATP-binding protein [Frigoribacterium sp. VKM Ac-2530]